MRTILLFFIFIIAFFYKANAQNNLYIDTLPWAPQGATWVYTGNPTMTIKYTHDSIINGKNVKAFKFYTTKRDSSYYPIPRPYIEYSGEEYLYNSNDSVFFYDQGLEEFVFMYDFNAQEGDVWNVRTSYLQCNSNNNLADSFKINIAYESITINSAEEYLIFSSANTDTLQMLNIIPNIGGSQWFFPVYNEAICTHSTVKYLNTYIANLICYTDNTRGRLITGNPPYNGNFDSTCTATINMVEDFIVGVEKPTLADNKNDKFSIYPNPAKSHLNVFSNGVFIKEIMIYNAVGRLVIQDKSQGDNINISMLNSGLYIINILDEKNEISAFKFVKE